MKNILFICLNGLIGIMFIFSAFIKFESLELFELSLVDTGIIGWNFTPFAARTIIAVELLTGILLLLQFRLRDLTLPFTIGLLSVFTIYLISDLILKGNSGNCNCFGSLIILTPAESIIKNVVLIILSVILLKYHKGFQWKNEKWLLVIFLLISFGLPYVLNPVTQPDAGINFNERSTYKLNLDPIYSDPAIIKPIYDLRSGKHIVACLSLKCSHCILAAYKLNLIKKKNPSVSIYFLVNGKTKDIQGFLKETKTYNIPQTLVLGKNFIALTGHQIPSIFYLENSYVVKKINYFQIDQENIEEWFGSDKIK
jgi:hypothetical protein